MSAVLTRTGLDEARELVAVAVAVREPVMAAAQTRLLRLPATDVDLVRAARLFAVLGDADRAAYCTHNRSLAALRAGELPTALRFFRAAERSGLRITRHPELLVDQAEALLAAGTAELAVRLFTAQRRAAWLPAVNAVLPRARLMTGSGAELLADAAQSRGRMRPARLGRVGR